MAKKLQEESIIPNLIVTSTAKRALTTAEYFAKELNLNSSQLITDKKLYLASSSEILGIINNLDNDVDTAFIFGHNPGMTDLANSLSSFRLNNLPTCGIIGFSLKGRWNELKPHNAQFIKFIYPKMYFKMDS